jgi:putative methyltransferase (TIGR04325 family)
MVKRVLLDLTPPILWRVLRATRPDSNRQEWVYIPEGWAYKETHPEVKGWNVADVLDVYKRKWPRFVAMLQGTGPLGVAHESDLSTNADVSSHNIIMTFAYVLTLAAQEHGALSLLDWGGGIGHFLALAQVLLPEKEIEYHCKDVPLLVQYGAQLFPRQHFYSDDTCLQRTYDLVMASVSMHYTQDWRGLVASLAKATERYLFIASLPVVLRAPSFVFVQRPYTYGYNTEYLGWCLNRDEFVACVQAAGLVLVREFVVGARPLIQGAPEQNCYTSFLFSPTKRDKG